MSPVYIGNLDPRVSERELEDGFRVFGVIRRVWVAKRPPGYGFVDFDDTRDAQSAIHELDGKNGWRVELSHGGGGREGGGSRGHSHECSSRGGDGSAGGNGSHSRGLSEDEDEDEDDTNFIGESSSLTGESKKQVRNKREESSNLMMTFINVYAENAKRRNDILEKQFTIWQAKKGQTSNEKNGVDEKLMECFKILNGMEDLDGKTYTKVLKVLHGDVTWRKLFLLMPDARKRDFINSFLIFFFFFY